MTGERAPQLGETTDFSMDWLVDFDINAAFQEAVYGIAQDTELALEEKVRRMEGIVTQGASELYRDFIDFRGMAAQMEIICSHDHTMSQSLQASEILSGFMAAHTADDGHDHSPSEQSQNEDDDDEDPRTRRKKKRKRASWLTTLVQGDVNTGQRDGS